MFHADGRGLPVGSSILEEDIMRNAKRWLAAIVVAALLVALVAVTGCTTTTTTTEPATTTEATATAAPKTVKTGILLVGSDTAYPPFESMEGSKAVGFDVDVAEAIAKKLDLELEVISTAWDGIIPGLKANKYDIIMSAMTITEDRKKQINFSDPYIDSDQSIAWSRAHPSRTRPASRTRCRSPARHHRPVQGRGDPAAGGIKEIQKFDTILLAFEALEQGKVDAIINDYPVNQYISTRGEQDRGRRQDQDRRAVRHRRQQGQQRAARQDKRGARDGEGRRDVRGDLHEVVRRGSVLERDDHSVGNGGPAPNSALCER